MNKTLTTLTLFAAGLTTFPAHLAAQGLNPQRNTLQARFAYQVVWSEPVPENTKLIEVGRVKHNDENYLVLLSDSRNSKDTQRTLTLAKWSGARFIPEGNWYLKGAATDALLVGEFRFLTAGGAGVTKENIKQTTKNAPKSRNTQVVTSDGIFEWNGKEMERIALSPVGVKLAIAQGKRPGIMVAGIGDTTSSFTFDGTALQTVTEFVPPAEDETYAYYGCGTQTYPGSEQMKVGAGARYVQSYWKNRNYWMLGYQPGKVNPLPDNPQATLGDRVVLFTPKPNNLSKSFWATSPTDMEIAWQSDAFPGRILDVRIGDPKNEGKEGIVLLIATNEERERRLYFIRKVDTLNPNNP